MTQKRQLAAILFADIAGYTALMQKDEQHASKLLNNFQKNIEAIVPSSNGQVVNFYGDGVLCVFDSPLEAVKCAMELQTKWQEVPQVPVRLGIHMGTVVFENEKVYGNSVNLASRMESMGVPGSILFSETVKNEIKNQANLQISSLGHFEFKNVEEPMEVFVLSNDGFVVPKKEDIKGKLKPTANKKSKWLWPVILSGLLLCSLLIWKYSSSEHVSIKEFLSGNASVSPLTKEVRDKRLAVMVFENQTMSTSLDAFGKMISDWLTRGLMETGEANVISAANIQNQIVKAGFTQGANPELATSTGVDVMIQGRYYLQEDKLIIHANIIDVKNGEVIHALQPIEGRQDNMLNLLDELTQEVLGYWTVRRKKRFLQNPPKYEAYQKYLEADKIWTDGEKGDQKEQLLIEAYHLDPSFYGSLLKLAVLYGNPGSVRSISKQDSVFQLIDDINPPFTKWEKLRFESIKASSKYEYLKSAQLNQEMYEMDPSDESSNYNAGYNYARANYPKQALIILNKIIDDNASNSWREVRKVEANYMLCNYEKVVELANEYPFPKSMEPIARLHLGALIYMDSIKTIQRVYNKYVEKGVYFFNGQKREPDNILESMCDRAYMLDNKDLLNQFLPQLLEWTAKKGDSSDSLEYKGLAAFYHKDYKTALSFWEKEKIESERIRRQLRITSKIAVCYAMMGNEQKAEAQLAYLSNFEIQDDWQKYNIDYFKGQILASLGRMDEALIHLKQAKKGLTFLPYGGWNEDIFLKAMLDYPPFQEIVKPKG